MSAQLDEQKFMQKIDAVAPLFRPFRLNGLDMPNRLAMAPMTCSFSPGNVPNAAVAAWAKTLSGKPSMGVGGIGLSDTLFKSLHTGGASVENNFFDAAEWIDRGEFDMLAIGRALLADSAWPKKIRAGEVPDGFRLDKLAELV